MMILIKCICRIVIGAVIALFLVVGGLIAYDEYTASHSDTIETEETSSTLPEDERSTASEDQLTVLDRLYRLFHIEDAVAEAINRRVSPDNQVREGNISDFAKKALIAAEDKRFYDHGAIDVQGIGRALYMNTMAGQTVEGGSTITQQLVKNIFLSSHRTFSRKLEEMVLAFLVERHYSKDEIITMYLNSVYFGNNYTGIKAAAQGYFDTTPARLSLAQSAMLAGLPQAPTYYNPRDNYQAAKERQYTVLMQMVAQDMISPAEAKSAFHDPLGMEDEPEFDDTVLPKDGASISLDSVVEAVTGHKATELLTPKKDKSSADKNSSKDTDNHVRTKDNASSEEAKRGDRAPGYIGN